MRRRLGAPLRWSRGARAGGRSSGRTCARRRARLISPCMACLVLHGIALFLRCAFSAYGISCPVVLWPWPTAAPSVQCLLSTCPSKRVSCELIAQELLAQLLVGKPIRLTGSRLTCSWASTLCSSGWRRWASTVCLRRARRLRTTCASAGRPPSRPSCSASRRVRSCLQPGCWWTI